MTYSAKVHKFPSKLSVNSLAGSLPTEVFENLLTDLQAVTILERACELYNVLVENEDLIRTIYGDKTTRLIENFAEILSYAQNVCESEIPDEHADYFARLSLFCGQIEQIRKLIRYYKAL